VTDFSHGHFGPGGLDTIHIFTIAIITIVGHLCQISTSCVMRSSRNKEIKAG
jgi:hypothetical protein